MLFDANLNAFLHRLRVEVAAVGRFETWLGHARETGLVASDDFVAIHRVSHAANASEFICGSIGRRAFGVEGRHLSVNEKGRMCVFHLFQILRACCTVANPALGS